MAFVRCSRVWLLLPAVFAALSAGCGGKEDDDELPAPMERTGPAGCYIEAERRCDCELEQTACTDVGIWVEMGCSSCAT